MKRREALKNIGFAAGIAVITPSILSLFQSCTSPVEAWKPDFLTTEQGEVLTKLSDIFLPKTEGLPSATELNVPQFIDKFLKDVLDDESQANLKIAFNNFISKLKPDATIKVENISEQEYQTLLDQHLLVKDEIDTEREANLDSLIPTTSEFLNHLKWMTINAYLTTEHIGENVLVYDPVPAQNYCGDLLELTGGKSYSL